MKRPTAPSGPDRAPRWTAREAATRVVDRITAAGHQAVFAGGCVRDLLLDLAPHDYDVATSARPADIVRLYPRAQQVGAHFGVVLVRQSGHAIEVATFRADGPYSDGRHPDHVTFATAEEDAWRRDFTINGMFWDPRTATLLDYVGGQDDLALRRIQAIGNPEQRFDEDYLRMLRAVRFAARFEFDIEPETYEAIYNRVDRIAAVAAERVHDELTRILVHPRRAAGFGLLVDTGLIGHLWPAADWSTERLARARRVLESLPAEAAFTTALAAILHQHAPMTADAVARGMTCSNVERRTLVWLLEADAAHAAGKLDTLAGLKRHMADPAFPALLDLIDAARRADGLVIDGTLRARAADIPPDAIAPAPWVSGNDLQDLGAIPGPHFRRILELLYDKQLNLELTSQNAAMAAATTLLEEHDA